MHVIYFLSILFSHECVSNTHTYRRERMPAKSMRTRSLLHEPGRILSVRVSQQIPASWNTGRWMARGQPSTSPALVIWIARRMRDAVMAPVDASPDIRQRGLTASVCGRAALFVPPPPPVISCVNRIPIRSLFLES